MKIALIYDPQDNKLRSDSYSQIYRHQLLALIQLFKNEGVSIQSIHNDCSATEISSDTSAIIFYDVHSCHHIKIDGIEKHPAIKYEYFDDPHQEEVEGTYSTGAQVHKLGAEQRCTRAINRAIDYIICPYRNGYFQFFAPYLKNEAEVMLIWFPVSPDIGLFTQRSVPLQNRKAEVLGNGAIACGNSSFYDFRKWAFCQPNVSYIPHWLKDKQTPYADQYADGLLAQYAGALALAEEDPVPKYFEMPLAGCVTFMQWNYDIYSLGFRDYTNCIFVDKNNFHDRINHFLHNIADYQDIANKGRELIEHKYTAQHFAQHIYNHIRYHTT
jgi:hypothetical protein